jgi:hypothetical protein
VTVPKEPASAEGFVYTGPITRRMSAEQFLDALWTITGQGPKAADKAIGKLHEVEPAGPPVRAAFVISDPLMRSLGRPNREQVVTTRPDLLTTLQALDLSNGPLLAETINKGAASISEKSPQRDELVTHLFRQAVSREPSSEERRLADEVLGQSMSPESVADFLWMVVMLPEFQHVQ